MSNQSWILDDTWTRMLLGNQNFIYKRFRNYKFNSYMAWRLSYHQFDLDLMLLHPPFLWAQLHFPTKRKTIFSSSAKYCALLSSMENSSCDRQIKTYIQQHAWSEIITIVTHLDKDKPIIQTKWTIAFSAYRSISKWHGRLVSWVRGS